MGALIDGLGVRGRLVVVGASAGAVRGLVDPADRREAHDHRMAGGNVKDSEDTLKFAAQTGVRAMIETFPIDRAEQGYDRMMTGKVRFRAVLTH